jgi:hypothetical protein
MLRDISRSRTAHSKTASGRDAGSPASEDALSSLRQRLSSAVFGAKGGTLTHEPRKVAGSPGENPVARLKLLLVSTLP